MIKKFETYMKESNVIMEMRKYKNMDIGDRVMIVGEYEPFSGHCGNIVKIITYGQYSGPVKDTDWRKKYLMVNFDKLGILPYNYNQLKLVRKCKRVISKDDPYGEEDWENE